MNKRTTIYLLIILILTSFLSVVGFVYVFRAVERKNEHTSQLLSEIESKTVNREDMEAFTKKVAEIQHIDTDIRTHFVDGKEIAGFIDFLESLGAISRVDVSVKSVDPVSTDKTKLTINLDTKGTYSDTMQLVNLLENSPYYIHITGVRITKEVVTQVDATGKPIPSKGMATWRGTITFTTLTSS